MSETSENYLRDLGQEIVARANRYGDQPPRDDYKKGRQLAFYEILNLMKGQAAAFGLSDKDIGLEGINPESLLT